MRNRPGGGGCCQPYRHAAGHIPITTDGKKHGSMGHVAQYSVSLSCKHTHSSSLLHRVLKTLFSQGPRAQLSPKRTPGAPRPVTMSPSKCNGPLTMAGCAWMPDAAAAIGSSQLVGSCRSARVQHNACSAVQVWQRHTLACVRGGSSAPAPLARSLPPPRHILATLARLTGTVFCLPFYHLHIIFACAPVCVPKLPQVAVSQKHQHHHQQQAIGPPSLLLWVYVRSPSIVPLCSAG